VVLILLWLQNSEAMVSIDMPAGPSEVLVIADKYANPVHVAADLLSQVHIFNDSRILLHSAGSCRGHVFSLKF
jgi:histidinol dehydrogenase